MFVGYARVSADDQRLDLQADALAGAGCEKVFTDKLSGAKADRPGLADALAFARTGDTLVVWRLDRLGRSLKDLIERVGELDARGVGLRSLRECVDTATPAGRLVFHTFGALAEFERDLLRERTNAGLQAARASGRVGGRNPKLDARQIAMAARLMKGLETRAKDVASMLGITTAPLYRFVSPGGIVRK